MEQNLYAEFTQKRFSLDVSMPFTKNDGSEVKLPMVVLTGRELFEAKKAAERATMAMYDGKMPKKDDASSFDGLYEEHLCWQLVFYSVRMPNDLGKKFFPTIDSVLDMLTPDQAGILKDCYIQLQISQPWVVNLGSDDEIENMIQKLIEGGTRDSFFFEFSQLSISESPHTIFGIKTEEFHEGYQLAWRAARQFRDMIKNPQNYQKQNNDPIKAGWNYNKIMLIHGQLSKSTLTPEMIAKLKSK